MQINILRLIFLLISFFIFPVIRGGDKGLSDDDMFKKLFNLYMLSLIKANNDGETVKKICIGGVAVVVVVGGIYGGYHALQYLWDWYQDYRAECERKEALNRSENVEDMTIDVQEDVNTVSTTIVSNNQDSEEVHRDFQQISETSQGTMQGSGEIRNNSDVIERSVSNVIDIFSIKTDKQISDDFQKISRETDEINTKFDTITSNEKKIGDIDDRALETKNDRLKIGSLGNVTMNILPSGSFLIGGGLIHKKENLENANLSRKSFIPDEPDNPFN